ncbi:general transcription factor 3C polypeptide 6-like [Glandiceps talaboti]
MAPYPHNSSLLAVKHLGSSLLYWRLHKIYIFEQLVLVELSGIIDTNFLSKERKDCKLLGVESEQPVLQIGRYAFTGEYKDTVGTAVIFEEETHVKSGDESSKRLKYLCHTLKKMEMNRAFLSGGATSNTATEVQNMSEDKDVAMETAETSTSEDVKSEVKTT